MPFRQFIWLTTLGSLIWNTVLIGIGALLGESFGKAAAAVDQVSTVIYVIIGIVFIACAALFIKKTLPRCQGLNVLNLEDFLQDFSNEKGEGERL